MRIKESLTWTLTGEGLRREVTEAFSLDGSLRKGVKLG